MFKRFIFVLVALCVAFSPLSVAPLKAAVINREASASERGPMRDAVRELFVDFEDGVEHLGPEDEGVYWAIPNGDSVQYFEEECDPENTACILGKTGPGGVTFARLRIKHDPSPAGYDNADLAGIPTGTTDGEGDQLWCVEQGHPFEMGFRARWSEEYTQSGIGDVAVGSSGFGVWSNPVQPDYSLAPTTAIFFQWVDGIGLSMVVTKAGSTMTEFVSFASVQQPIDMNSWQEYKVKVKYRPDGDKITFLIKVNSEYVTVNEAIFPGHVGCLSLEAWNDMQAYDFFGNVFWQNLPAGENQHLDVDWYDFTIQ